MGSRVKTETIQVTVTTAGTRVQISSTNKLVKSVIFQAHPDNAGRIYIGASDVASNKGIVLSAGNSVSISGDMMGMGGDYELDLSDFYVDSASNGDIVIVQSLVLA